ncbi:MAG TPA: ATP-binding cassette domain-containing protein [Candidatus Eremiobacteraeota bacterium]|nr:MAG: putative ABC transporter ATP-binding protein YbhF [bacterium ADurb.Bin363]HPZ08359.1 ATP-binding cassette domain-containing protein [Candidatus Eremiobacteraeota bacterium]
MIKVEKLIKTFHNYKRREGIKGAFFDLFQREYKEVCAVCGVSFQISAGELVGYIGANGAGKSTTIKMLTGILIPTSGLVCVAGYVPYKQRIEYTKNIGVVFGQRTQLWWDIAVIESFRLLRKVYEVDKKIFEERLNNFNEMLDLKDLLYIPLRKLSLGQRMRCDLVASLLHNPKVLFLDEPTIGLDVEGRVKIREFLAHINKTEETTIILTTHNLDEIEKLCKRVIIIDKGRILYDGLLSQLKESFSCGKRVIFVFDEEKTREELNNLGFNGQVGWKKLEPLRYEASFDRKILSAAEIISKVMAELYVKDMSIEETAIEDVVRKIYREGNVNL